MIGIIPAAGDAIRMFQIPKFLLPIDDSYLLACLQSRMHFAGARDVYTGAHPRHYNLPALRPERTNAYWVETNTMNETVLAAHSFTMPSDNEFVLFGMPDTYWTDTDVYQRLIEQLNVPCIASVALWNTPAEYISKRGIITGMHGNYILGIVDKPSSFGWILGWGAMAWSSTFWQYILPEDAHVGFALQRAIDVGEKVQGVVMDGQFWDCGTPDEYFDCIRALDTVKV